MTFRVGQKVVCVDDQPRFARRGFSGGLTAGTIYTIRWIGEAAYAPDRAAGMAVRLVEIVRPDHPLNPEWSDYPFGLFRFRPVVERKTDITVFTEILRKATKPARTPAIALQHRA